MYVMYSLCIPYIMLCYVLLLLPKPSQMKFKHQQPQQQQKKTQLKYENSTKESKLHFCDLQLIYICKYASYICYS